MKWRIIYSLELDIDAHWLKSPAQLVVPLDRTGQSRNIKPLSGKTRAIDLRIGDELIHDGREYQILDIKAYRDGYSESAPAGDGDGYVIEQA